MKKISKMPNARKREEMEIALSHKYHTSAKLAKYDKAIMKTTQRIHELDDKINNLYNQKENAKAYFLRGNLYYSQNDEANALADYASAIEEDEENYDLYIGEVKLTPDMSLIPFFSETGNLNYGIDTESSTAKAYYDFISGKIDISTFIQVFSLDMPFIPLLFRDGIAYYSRELTYEDNINEYEPFRNIYSWSIAN